MGRDSLTAGPAFSATQQPALRFLVESALRKVKSTKENEEPHSREDWIVRLSEALMSDSESAHKSVIAALLATGVRTEQVFETYIPEAARYLGEMWVKDRLSFVDVTVGAARLQALFRNRPDGTGRSVDRTIPLGQSMLMLIPAFEDHSLGAFVAADQFRRHGMWVHMGIGLSEVEAAEIIEARRFSLVGISVATWSTLEKVTELVDYLRSNLDRVPPIVIGGRAVTDTAIVTRRTGADFAVRTAREAVERCGLSTVGSKLMSEGS